MSALKRLGKVVPLGGQPWRGVGPFVYAAHHLDLYPVGNKHLGPDPKLLQGRKTGSDFNNESGTDWNMYMATGPVPGFPAHPHRGFETISIVGWKSLAPLTQGPARSHRPCRLDWCRRPLRRW
jgi:hypothetical protein